MNNELTQTILEYVPKDELINGAIANLTDGINDATVFAIIITVIFVITLILLILALVNKKVEEWFDKYSSFFFWNLFVLAISFLFSAVIWLVIGNAYSDLADLNSGIEPIQLTTAIEYYSID